MDMHNVNVYTSGCRISLVCVGTCMTCERRLSRLALTSLLAQRAKKRKAKEKVQDESIVYVEGQRSEGRGNGRER